MPADVYLQINDQTVGPITTEALEELIRQGRVTPDTPLRRGQNGPWIPASKIKGFHDVLAVAPKGEPIELQQRGPSGLRRQTVGPVPPAARPSQSMFPRDILENGKSPRVLTFPE